MAITQIISATVNAVAVSAATEFTTTDRGFWLKGAGFAEGEMAVVYGLGPDGTTFRPETNKGGVFAVSAFPNTIFCDLPAGVYRVGKVATAFAASVGYEAVV